MFNAHKDPQTGRIPLAGMAKLFAVPAARGFGEGLFRAFKAMPVFDVSRRFGVLCIVGEIMPPARTVYAGAVEPGSGFDALTPPMDCIPYTYHTYMYTHNTHIRRRRGT